MGFYDKFKQMKATQNQDAENGSNLIDLKQDFKDKETKDNFTVDNIDIDINNEIKINNIRQIEKANEEISVTKQNNEIKQVRKPRNINYIQKQEVNNDILKYQPKIYTKMKQVELKTQEDIINEIKELNTIHTTWRDYCLLMLNSTAEPLRSIWREKIVTSVTHWEFNSGSISEGNLAGLEILSVLPSELTMKVVDDYAEPNEWKKLGRLAGSKRMNVHIGHYPQESLSNEANLCLKYIVYNWDEYSHLIFETPLLKRMWYLAQESLGQCILPDEVCTYILEKPVDDNKYGVWIDVAYDVFKNGIPSDKYKKYWKSDKIENFPLATFNSDTGKWYYKEDGRIEELTLEKQKENFLNMCDIILREDVSMSPCWKKICICILKNDVTMKYAGFSATLRERKAREDAIAAFSMKQEERKQAEAAAKELAAKIEKERLEMEKDSLT